MDMKYLSLDQDGPLAKVAGASTAPKPLASFLRFHLQLSLGTNKKKDLIQIQWFVAIATSYLLVVQEGRIVEDPFQLLLVVVPLASIITFLRLPDSVFSHKAFPQAMALIDTALICTAIVFNKESPWDLFLVFFFGIFIAAIGENLLQVVVGCLILSVVSVVLGPLSGKGSFELDSDTLLRIPLLFGASLVYGYLADQVKNERKKAARLEEGRKQQLLTKDQFFSHVSHELRTPLTAVYQFVTILLDGIAGDLNEEQRDYLEIVLRNVKQLQTMVAELLEAARADSGKLAIDPRGVSAVVLVNRTLDMLAAGAAVKGIELSAEISPDLPLVYADPQRLSQILTNLIDNAMKFTPSKGSITVCARVDDADSSFVRLSVADTGCGISPDGVTRIFDRLYQEEKTLETNRKGLGLGLYICKELVTRHGGRIWVESELEKGSTFYLTLPVLSLKDLLSPIVNKKNRHFSNFAALIAVEVLPDSLGPISEVAWKGAWTALKQLALPERSVLLPKMAKAGDQEMFFLLHAGDLKTANQLASRVKNDLGNSRDVQDAKCSVKVSVMTMNSPLVQDSVYVETLAGAVLDKIKELTKRASLNKADQSSRTDLINAMSREVRTPLNVVLGYAGILRDKLLGELNAEQASAVAKVMGQTHDLLLLISNMVEAHKLESGSITAASHEVHIGSLLEELKLSYDFPLEKNVRTVWNYPSDLPVIVSDGNKLRMILGNLINNALKFTPEGVVKISARYVCDSNSVDFEVADTGVGIPKGGREAIFEKLRQLSSPQEGLLSGMGLGLYIVKAFTDSLGGKISVESESGMGSVFKVTVPLKREPAMDQPKPADSILFENRNEPSGETV